MLPSLRETLSRSTPTVTDEASMTVTETRPASGLPDEDGWGLDLWVRVIGLGVVMGLFLSFVGALGTGEAPFLKRLGYWETVIIGGSVLAIGVNYLVRVRLMPKVSVFWQDVATVILTTVVITAFVFAVTPPYWGYGWHRQGLWGMGSAVFFITLIMTFLHYALDRKPRQSHAFVPMTETPEAPEAVTTPLSVTPVIAFYDRLPPKFNGLDIRALSAEDHYLRVHTTAGEALILMRLYDAIRELEGIEGSQTHRSWWVARSAVLEVLRRDGRVTLRLEGGLQVPVSRSFQKSLREDGWL